MVNDVPLTISLGKIFNFTISKVMPRVCHCQATVCRQFH